jgi:uncharacterized membrane protein
MFSDHVAAERPKVPGSGSPPIAGWLLGFALGGFFDGILLHQILQWHHLLSALEGRDLRFQVAADGYFHALMYVIAVAGLWLLWRDRNAGTMGGRRITAAMLVGFGVWHLVDGVLSHWVLGIHRIRMDSDNRLFWDVLWLALFGAVPLLAGWLLSRNLAKPPDLQGRHLAALIATVIVSGAGAATLRPPPETGFTTVLFRPDASPADVLGGVAAVDARLVWADASGQLVVLQTSQSGSAWKLYRHGAVLVSRAGLPNGCFSWSRP